MPVKSGYSYYKEVTVNHTDDGAQSLYQMKLLVGESSGATGEDVDCEGHCLSTFNDLWFQGYDADGVTIVDLDYWIESITGTTPNQLATVWVEIHYIPAHPDNTTVWMSYGKAGASAASSGANTFGAQNFDNFEWGSNGDNINTSGGNITWTEITTNVDVSTEQEYTGIASDTRSMKVLGAATYSEARKTQASASSATLSYYMRVYKENATNDAFPLIHGNGTKIALVCLGSDEKVYYYSAAAARVDTGKTITADAWNTIEVNNINFAAATFDIWVNGSKASATAMWTSALWTDVWGITNRGLSSGDDFYMDNVIVRKWTANEPTWGSWGTEQGDAALCCTQMGISPMLLMS